LPEGRLRAELIRRFSKTVEGGMDDFRLLQLTGHSQIGRLRYASFNQAAPTGPPTISLSDLIQGRGAAGAEELFHHLLATYGPHSGLSGEQPKVLVPVSEAIPARPDRAVFNDATHIVKLWEEGRYPELAANEYFCLIAASRAGLPIPDFRLSEDGRLLILDRFDLAPGGGYLGFEDFCALRGWQAGKRYAGSYEQVAETMRRFIAPREGTAALAFLFDALALSVAVRNGDAHLKNFGVLYDAPEPDKVRPAPVYDIVTTTAYLPADAMALTLEGSKRWPDEKRLLRFAEQRCGLSRSKARQALERIADAVQETIPDIEAYMRQRTEFREVGLVMVERWGMELG
jgi:serine/threonine-protein kinase HipA